MLQHRLRHLLVGFFALLAVALTSVGPAQAGGSWFYPVLDRYEPGDRVTLVGYSGGGTQGWVDDAPFFGYLVGRVDDDWHLVDRGVAPLPLGEIDLAKTNHGGYLSYRAAISFDLPADSAPGLYRFDYCNNPVDGCGPEDVRFGDLIGGHIHVGVDPTYDISREWAPDEPEIANLSPGTTLSGPAFWTGDAELERVTPDLTPPPRSPREQVAAKAPENSSGSVDNVRDAQQVEPTVSVVRARSSVAIQTVDTAIDWPAGTTLFVAAIALTTAVGLISVPRRRRSRQGQSTGSR